MGRADKSAQVTKAVLAIRSGEYTDYSNAANKFHCSRTAVMRRITGQTKTRQEAHSFWHQCLTNDEEEILISRINTLTDRGLPPTSQIVRNLAEEIRRQPVGKNWVGQFCKRHKLRLKSAYLRNIDNIRVSAEYAPMFILFFQLVCVLFRVIFVPTPYGWSV
jgi:Tc5 transposase DNA-binding domain